MLDPNKHGVFNKEKSMSDAWLTRIVWLGMLFGSITIWYFIIKLIFKILN